MNTMQTELLAHKPKGEGRKRYQKCNTEENTKVNHKHTENHPETHHHNTNNVKDW